MPVLKQVTPLDHAYAELATIRRQVEALQRTLAALINDQAPAAARKTQATLTDPRTGKTFAKRATRRRRTA